MANIFEDHWDANGDDTATPTGWDSKTDTNSMITTRHYKSLARRGYPMPWSGSSVLEVDCSNLATDQYVEEGDVNVSANGTFGFRAEIYVTGLTTAASDRFTVMTMQSSGPTNEVSLGIRNNAGTLEWWVAETDTSTVLLSAGLTEDRWEVVELTGNIDAGGGNDGDITFILNDTTIGSTASNLDQGAILQARVGAIATDAGTTAGRFWINSVAWDDTGRYSYVDRFQNPRELRTNQHYFLGQGTLEFAALSSTNSDNVIRFYDTDIATVTGQPVLELDPDANVSASVPLPFSKGCYVWFDSSATAPRLQVMWSRGGDQAGIIGPWAITEANIKSLAFRG